MRQSAGWETDQAGTTPQRLRHGWEAFEWPAHPKRGTAGQLNEQGLGRRGWPLRPLSGWPRDTHRMFGPRNDERGLNEAEPAGCLRRAPC